MGKTFKVMVLDDDDDFNLDALSKWMCTEARRKIDRGESFTTYGGSGGFANTREFYGRREEAKSWLDDNSVGIHEEPDMGLPELNEDSGTRYVYLNVDDDRCHLETATFYNDFNSFYTGSLKKVLVVDSYGELKVLGPVF